MFCLPCKFDPRSSDFSFFFEFINSVICATFRRQKSFDVISGANSSRKISRSRRFCLATSFSFWCTLVFVFGPKNISAAHYNKTTKAAVRHRIGFKINFKQYEAVNYLHRR